MTIVNSFSKTDLDSLILDISNHLFQTKSYDKKRVLNSSLKLIVEKLTVDRCYIVKISKHSIFVSKEYESRREKIKSHNKDLKNLSYKSVEPLLEKLSKEGTLDLRKIDYKKNTPLLENKIFQFHAPRSSLIIPMFDKDKLTGFLGVEYQGDALHPTEHVIVSFKIIATLLNSAISKFESKDKLRRVNKSLGRTIKKEVEKSNQQAKMMFQQAKFAQMGEMLSMIAHQWRQPLNAVSIAASSLKLDIEFDTLSKENIKVSADFIEEQVGRMSETINDFMEFFKPDKAKENFRLSVVVNNIRKVVEAQTKSKNIELIVDLEEDITIYGHKNEFEHVILNLIANARDALKNSPSRDRKIIIRATQEKSRTVIKVSDNGGGIEKDNLEKIFNPYFTTKIHDNGTGIGLYMVKSIIEKNFNGKIDVQNCDGGAQFTIKLKHD